MLLDKHLYSLKPITKEKIMQTVAEIMATNVISLKESDNVHQARMLMKKYSIRHIPIVDDQKHFVGLLTQRDLLNHAFKIVENYGFSKLAQREERTQISDVMTRDCMTLRSDSTLRSAGEFFITHKHGSIPIVNDGRLVGILTSIDFIKLAMQFLKD